MTSNDISYLKQKLEDERARIERLNNLLQDDTVKEYLKLKGIKEKSSYSFDEWKVISDVLKDYTVDSSNGIYVCTGSYLTECSICYQETNYYTQSCDFDDPYLEYRTYMDIETGHFFKAYYRREYAASYMRNRVTLIKDFEARTIVLNPFNTNKNDNGFEIVRKEFFTTALEKGQEEAKRLVLEKYARMKPYTNAAKRYL